MAHHNELHASLQAPGSVNCSTGRGGKLLLKDSQSCRVLPKILRPAALFHVQRAVFQLSQLMRCLRKAHLAQGNSFQSGSFSVAVTCFLQTMDSTGLADARSAEYFAIPFPKCSPSALSHIQRALLECRGHIMPCNYPPFKEGNFIRYDRLLSELPAFCCSHAGSHIF